MPPRIEKVYAILSSRVRVPRWVIEAGGRGSYGLAVLSYALKADDGWYLIDAGMREVLAGLRSFFPWIAAFGAVRSVADSLRDLGAAPEDVRAVFLTHLDYDHTGALPRLAHAPVVLSRAERRHADAVLAGAIANALSPKRLWEWSVGRQRGEDVRAPRVVRELDPPPQPLGARGGEMLARGVAALEGGAVHLVDLPGHSAGHAGFHVRLASGRELLFVGDAAFSDAHTAGHEDLGTFPLLVAHDRARALDTLAGLRALRRERPELAILCAHDEALGERALAGPIEL